MIIRNDEKCGIINASRFRKIERNAKKLNQNYYIFIGTLTIKLEVKWLTTVDRLLLKLIRHKESFLTSSGSIIIMATSALASMQSIS